jgi:hypothetical protein
MKESNTRRRDKGVEHSFMCKDHGPTFQKQKGAEAKSNIKKTPTAAANRQRLQK